MFEIQLVIKIEHFQPGDAFHPCPVGTGVCDNLWDVGKSERIFTFRSWFGAFVPRPSTHRTPCSVSCPSRPSCLVAVHVVVVRRSAQNVG